LRHCLVSDRCLISIQSTYDDYLEMFIQFGYVILFSSVYPAAALCAVINNVLEVRADAFKLCRVTRRPLPKRVKDNGAWQARDIFSAYINCSLP
jgi:Calcium-activated chloride channel